MTSKPRQIGGQVLDELNGMTVIVKQYADDMGWEIRKYLEVGAREGYALRRLVEDLDAKTVGVIDWPGQDWGKVGSDQHLIKNLEYLEEWGVKTRMWLDDSRSAESKAFAEAWGPWDLCLIDASHVYEDVVSDFNYYGPLSKIVVLHDINHPPESRAYGPTKLWNEIVDSGRYRTKEVIAEGSRKGLGIIFND